jgi:hypothetical protein
VLLFKAQELRTKDKVYFLNVASGLSFGERDWLKQALQMAHPGSSWEHRLNFAP